MIFGISSCVFLSCYLYRPDYPYASPSDTRPVTNNINFLFCEVVSIESPGTPMDVYSFMGPVKIDSSNTKHVYQKTALYSSVNSYNFFTLYLLPGSTAKIQHCTKALIVFYVFSGAKHFKQWKDDPYCEFCYDAKIYLLGTNDCRWDSDYKEFDLNVTNEGEVFFVYANEDLESAWVDLILNINRTVYDLRDAARVCTDVTECQVSLDEPDITAVYHVEDGSDIGELDHSKFTTKCVPRVWAYFLTHGLGILLIGITCSILIQNMCKDRYSLYNNTSFSGYSDNERTPLLYDPSALPPSYNTVTLSPPKYEDIVRDCEDPPPYLEAIAALAARNNSLNVNTTGIETSGERVDNSSNTTNSPSADVQNNACINTSSIRTVSYPENINQSVEQLT